MPRRFRNSSACSPRARTPSSASASSRLKMLVLPAFEARRACRRRRPAAGRLASTTSLHGASPAPTPAGAGAGLLGPPLPRPHSGRGSFDRRRGEPLARPPPLPLVSPVVPPLTRTVLSASGGSASARLAPSQPRGRPADCEPRREGQQRVAPALRPEVRLHVRRRAAEHHRRPRKLAPPERHLAGVVAGAAHPGGTTARAPRPRSPGPAAPARTGPTASRRTMSASPRRTRSQFGDARSSEAGCAAPPPGPGSAPRSERRWPASARSPAPARSPAARARCVRATASR